MSVKYSISLIALAAAATFVPAAHASTISGTTTPGPTWTRPVANLSGLSGIGIGVRYSVTPFFVSSAGSYDFTSTAVGFWDNFTFLYQNTFDPTSQFTNALRGNDDKTFLLGISGFDFNLIANTQYQFVTTGRAPANFGAWDLSITGPGTITFGTITVGVVPEPGIFALTGLGLAGVLLATRRRKQN